MSQPPTSSDAAQPLPGLPELHPPLPTRTLSSRKPTRFDIKPDPAARQALAQSLGLLDLPEFRFRGEIRPIGRNDFELEAKLDAIAIQPCAITLAPVTTAVSETVLRRYLSDWQEPEGDEVEMPEDETQEPLPDAVDLTTVAAEALELALPLYPRAEGAELGEAVFADPGTAPIRDSDLKPFASLATLRDKLGAKPDGE